MSTAGSPNVWVNVYIRGWAGRFNIRTCVRGYLTTSLEFHRYCGIIIWIIIIINFQVLGLLACSGFRTYFSETYESIWTVGRTTWTGDRPDARPLPTQDNTTQKNAGHTSMPRVGFEPKIPVFERPKTVRALDCSATGTGKLYELWTKII
jgi:hypothetical protein